MSARKLGTLLILSLGFIFGLLLYCAYHEFYQNGMQAEVKVNFSFIHTLQRGYRLEHGHFAFFDYYGAESVGRDNCVQPLAAAELGFILRGCHSKNFPPPRYAYRARDIGAQTLELDALSGSDDEGRSFVCFAAGGSETWKSSKNMEFIAVSSCW